MLVRFLVTLVDGCRRHARWVVATALVASLVLGYYVVSHLSMDTDTGNLFPEDLPWREQARELDEAFPQSEDRLVVVIDADTPARADRAAARLAARLEEQPTLFRSVNQPGGGDFFRRNGLLYLSVEELSDLSEWVVEAQPLLGSLGKDPTTRGLFEILSKGLDGLADGTFAPDLIARPLAAVAETLESVLAGRAEPLPWRTLIVGREPESDELRRFLLVQPVLDYGGLRPGAEASAALRADARELGLTSEHGARVRLTGSVALNDEEFGTVAEGMGLATVLSFGLVSGLLLLAVRSIRLVLCMLATLIVGIIATGAFAALAVGSLNLISIAFVVLFVGIAVDFGIQFCVRYRAERGEVDDLAQALRGCAARVGSSMALAAATTAAGFLSLTPTDYRGVAELGLISGAGMAIALGLNLTLLPALIALARPGPERLPAGFAWAEGLDRWLERRRRIVSWAALAIGLASLAVAAQLRFDFDPIKLKDPRTESVSTLFELIGSPSATPFTIDALAPSLPAAARLAAKLEALPEVDKVITLQSFVPDDQEEKLTLIEDLALLIGPVAVPEVSAVLPSPESTLPTLVACREKLLDVPVGSALHAPAERLAGALEGAIASYASIAPTLQEALLSELPAEIETLELALSAEPLSVDSLPEDMLRDWLAPDGRARLEVFPKDDTRDNRALRRFAEAVRKVAPRGSGAPVSIIESGRTVVNAFVAAGVIALATITLLLGVALRRARDVLMVLMPLLLAGLISGAVCVLIGLPLNFANIIALPLLLGIGVSFAIYFVINWRRGLTRPLQSPTARAVLFSALTTAAAFGSLAASGHPGTASMGKLLSISLISSLLCTLLVLPALLGSPPMRSSPSPP